MSCGSAGASASLPIVVRTATTSTPRSVSGPSSAAAASPSSAVASSALRRSVPDVPASVSFGCGYQVSRTVPSVATVASPTPLAPVVSGFGLCSLTAFTVAE